MTSAGWCPGREYGSAPPPCEVGSDDSVSLRRNRRAADAYPEISGARIHAPFGTFVVEEAAREPGFSGYLETFDEVIEAESQYFEGLPSGLVSSLAAVTDGTGLLSEMLAYDQLLRSKEDDEKKKEKKEAASSLEEELSAILPSRWPSWLEKIIESILSLL